MWWNLSPIDVSEISSEKSAITDDSATHIPTRPSSAIRPSCTVTTLTAGSSWTKRNFSLSLTSRVRTMPCWKPTNPRSRSRRSKEKLDINLPVQIGYFNLQYAKLRMLQFYYDCLDVYVDRTDFSCCKMDMDSAYVALSRPDLASGVTPHMRDSYQQTLTGYCREGVDPEWFPRTCCSKHAKYDQRTPGLFKIEYEGDAMIGLLVCSKTYIVQKTTPIHTSSTAMSCFRLLRRAKKLPPKRLVNRPRLLRQVKFSSKGITKPRVKAPMTTFRDVLNTQRVGHGTLKGFRARNNGISTYEQIRNGFSNFIVNGESWTTGSRPFR